jgi:excinuclease ABC subunit A
MNNKIILKKINQNNFQNVSIEIEKNKFIVVTGPSGCGKSTLVIDIIYAEGQRKFIESLPHYARQFIPLPEKPNMEEAIGLTPCIAIDQKTNTTNNRSTVGTVSEIYDYIRIMYTTLGISHCIECQKKIISYNPQELAELLINDYNNTEITILMKINIKNNQGKEISSNEKITIISELIAAGYTHFNINKNNIFLRSIQDIQNIPLKKNYDIDVILYQQNSDHHKDILISIIKLYYSYIDIITININNTNYFFSYKKKCCYCNNKKEYSTLSQKLFSFNLPTGACYGCKGTGLANNFEILDILDFSSLTGESIQNKPNEFCKICSGKRLNQEALSVLVNNMNIFEFCQISFINYHFYISNIKNQYHYNKEITDKICDEIEKRINLLIDLGLGYLNLSRNTNSLSGGELQRIRLAGQLGSALTGVTYILDEPSIGLHQSDNTKLISTIKKLRDIGNTVIVVEHDDETMLAADHIIDIGPGAGKNGGRIVFEGNPIDILDYDKSVTGQYLSNKKLLTRKKELNKGKETFTVINANKNNLKNITIDIPLGNILVVITGVSGSGKSTLIFDEFIPQGMQYLNNIIAFDKTEYKKNKIISKTKKKFEDIILVDQESIGKTNRSTVGTYFGFFDSIRELFALLPESKIYGLKKGDFSFNTSKFKCQNCLGKGYLIIEMEPLPPTIIHCTFCDGQRYTKTILKITYNQKNIFEVLKMSIEEAAHFFILHKKIYNPLKALMEVGLGYITLNQSADTFSGGEAQRVKLAYELNRRGNNTIYVLDEPTTGLHFQDIDLLLKIFDKLIEKGNTLIVIEHNLSIIRYADYIIDIGPEGGENGGRVVATGTPENIKNNKESLTGKYI